MEDKYFNEFFDKLYNGKLNIYEDEEEETSEEDVIKEEIFLNNSTNFKKFKKDLEIIENGSEFLYDYMEITKSKSYVANNIESFCRIYGYSKNQGGKNDPTWRKYTNNLEKEKREILIKYIGVKLEEKIKKLCLQKLIFRESDWDNFKIYLDTIMTGNFLKLRKNRTFMEKILPNFFWLYDIGKHKKSRRPPKWVEVEKEKKAHLKELINQYIKEKGYTNSIKERLTHFNKYFNQETNTLSDFLAFRHDTFCNASDDIMYNWSFSGVESNVILNSFLNIFGKGNSKKVLAWAKISDKDIKKDLKDLVKEKHDLKKFEERLDELVKEREILRIDIVAFSDNSDTIMGSDYSDMKKNFIQNELNGFWELFGLKHNNGNQPAWRLKIREDNDIKEYLKNLVIKKHKNFEERLFELKKQKNKEKPYWKKFQESFTGLFNYNSDTKEGTQYFKEKEWKNTYSKRPQDESLESESQIHTLWDNKDDINLINFINEKVNQCYAEVPKSSIIPKTVTIGDKKYLRTKLKKGELCPLSGNPKNISGFTEWLEKDVVKEVKNHVLNYLKTDGVKVKKFDLECVSPIGDVIKQGFKIEVKHQKKLDGRFAQYIGSGGSSSSVPSVLGREIYKEFVYTLLGRDKEGNVNVDVDSEFIYNKIIEDNCKHFDGMFIGQPERGEDKLIIYVPKEYIKFYISTQGQSKGDIFFTLRYHINPENVNNFYKVVRPEDYKNDNKYSDDLKIKPLNEFDKKKVKRWGGKMVNPIYMYDGDGLCPQGQSVDESYDSYLDQLVENFFNTGKLFP